MSCFRLNYTVRSRPAITVLISLVVPVSTSVRIGVTY